MAFIIELMKRSCTKCENEVWVLFKSQEEYNTFQCTICPEFIEYLNYIESKQIRD